jgi:hypothetical protein
MKTFLLVLFASLFLLISCKEFTSYNLEGTSTDILIKINGKITDQYSGKPVRDAQVTVGPRSTVTDLGGKYNIYFPLSTDENRDKPVPITISAYNYVTYTEERVFYPEDIQINLTLIYAAPIIFETTITPVYGGYDGGHYHLEALIGDYQGLSDITSAQAAFRYVLGTVSFWRYFTLDFVRSVDGTRGYFACDAPMIPETGEYFNGRYEIKAWDREGHEGFYFNDYH